MAAELRDHRPGRQLHRLADQRECVLVVAVDDDDGEVRVLADDQVGRLLHRDGERHHLVAELGQDVAEAHERLLVLVGEQHAQVGRPQGADGGRRGHVVPGKVVRAAGEIAAGGMSVPEHPDASAGMHREMTSVEFIDDQSDLERAARAAYPAVRPRARATMESGSRGAHARGATGKQRGARGRRAGARQ